MSLASREVSHPLMKLKDSQSESMWDDYEIGFDKSKYYEDMDDFFKYAAGDWTITTTEAGSGNASEAITDAAGGVLLLTNDDADNDLDNLQKVGEVVLPAAGKKMWFEARFKVSDADQSDMFLGLAVTDTSLVAGVTDGIYFKSDDGDALLDFESMASSVSSGETGIHTLVDDTYVKVGFKVVGANLIEYWVNDVKKGSVATNVPATELRVSMSIQNGAAAAKTMSVDYIRVVGER